MAESLQCSPETIATLAMHQYTTKSLKVTKQNTKGVTQPFLGHASQDADENHGGHRGVTGEPVPRSSLHRSLHQEGFLLTRQ